jgi:hypothetical protein
VYNNEKYIDQATFDDFSPIINGGFKQLKISKYRNTITLPLTLNPAETFQIEIFKKLYNMRQLWNERGQYWTLDINDEDNNPLVLGVKLVTGTTLLKQHPSIRFDIKSDSLKTDPTRNDLDTFVFNVINKDE